MRSGKDCTFPRGLRLPKGQRCAHDTGGLCTLGLCLSPTITCPGVIGACAVCFAFDLVPTVCQLRWAGACEWLMLPAFAPGAQACMQAMRGIMFLTAPHLMTFACGIPGFLRQSWGTAPFHVASPAEGRCILLVADAG